MRNAKVIVLVEVALVIALAVVLNFIQLRLPFNVVGGSINLSMLPIAVLALRRGVLAGATAGAVFGTLDLLIEPLILYPLQVIMDYPLPYMLFGVGVGLFSGLYTKLTNRLKDEKKRVAAILASLSVILALIVGGILRLFCHTYSGVLFFSEYANDFFAENPGFAIGGAFDTGLNVWIYSVIYNASYLVPSLIATAACALIVLPVLALVVPVVREKKLRNSNN